MPSWGLLVIDYEVREKRLRAYELQDLEVQVLPEQISGTSERPYRVWTQLDGRRFLLHNRHISNGVWRKQSCVVCRKGLTSVVRTFSEGTPADEVVQGGGVDEEKPATYPSNNWWVRE